MGSEGRKSVAGARGVVVAPDSSLPDDGPSEQDLQCVAVLCWLESWKNATSESFRVLFGRYRSLAEFQGLALRAEGFTEVADSTSAASRVISGVISAIKLKAEGCNGDMFSCIGKASLASVVLSVTSILFFFVGHALSFGAATMLAGKSFFWGIGTFFANIFKHLCTDTLDESTATELVHDLNASLVGDNPEAPGMDLSADLQNKVIGMLLRVQATRKRIDSDSAFSAKIAKLDLVGRGFQAMIGLHTLEDVLCYCDSTQAEIARFRGESVDDTKAIRRKHHGGVLEGWVWKVHRYTRQMRRRWLVLTPQHLAWFSSECSGTPTETVLAGAVQKVYDSDEVNLQPFGFMVELDGRHILMFADDEDQREAWIKAIDGTLLGEKP